MIQTCAQQRFSQGDWVREYLRGIFIVQVEKGFVTPRDLSERVGRSHGRCSSVLSKLEREGFVQKTGAKRFVGVGGKGKLKGTIPTKYVLTEKGRSRLTVVLTGGAFDILHMGHLATLNAAKRLGDVLIVVIARNETVQKRKGREPMNDEKVRLYLANSLKPVDLAVLGSREDPYKMVTRIKPDVIALGYDQRHDEEEIVGKLKQIGLATKVVRLSVKVPDVKTSSIISEIRRTNYDIDYI